MIQRRTGICWTMSLISIDQPHDPFTNRRWNLRTEFLQIIDQMLQMSVHNRMNGLAIKRPASRETLVVNTAQGIKIAPTIQGFAQELLGGHVKDGAKNVSALIFGLLPSRVRHTSQTEIHDLRLQASAWKTVHLDVFRLQIAMQNVHLMRGEYAFKRLCGELFEVAQLHGAILEPVIQRISFQQFHDDEHAHVIT